MIPRDYSSCTSSLARICGSMNLAMSAQIFVGGLGAVAPETAAFFDTECRSCAVCETCKGLICKDLRYVVDSTAGDVVQLVRTLPCRWLESHTITAVLLLGVIINNIYHPTKACSSPTRSLIRLA